MLFIFDLVETLARCGFDVSHIIVQDLLPQTQVEFFRLLLTQRINAWSIDDHQLTIDIWPATFYPLVQDICYRGQDLTTANDYCAHKKWEATKDINLTPDKEEQQLLFTVDNQLYLYRVAQKPKLLGETVSYVLDVESEVGQVAKQLLVNSNLAPTLQRSS